MTLELHETARSSLKSIHSMSVRLLPALCSEPLQDYLLRESQEAPKFQLTHLTQLAWTQVHSVNGKVLTVCWEVQTAQEFI